MDLRAIIHLALRGRGPRWLAERVHARWITARSPRGVSIDTAEETLARWLGEKRPQIPLAALEAALDALDLEVRPRKTVDVNVNDC